METIDRIVGASAAQLSAQSAFKALMGFTDAWNAEVRPKITATLMKRLAGCIE